MSVDDQRLQGAFSDLLGAPPPHADPLSGVHRRVHRMQRRRTAVAAVAASLTVVGAAAAIYGITRPAHRAAEPANEVAVVNPNLSLRVTAPSTVAVGAAEPVKVDLTGIGEAADTYGLRIAWGDGTIDRLYGSNDCQAGTAGPLNVRREFEHNYPQPGPERIIVELTRCGEVKARTITRIAVTPSH